MILKWNKIESQMSSYSHPIVQYSVTVHCSIKPQKMHKAVSMSLRPEKEHCLSNMDCTSFHLLEQFQGTLSQQLEHSSQNTHTLHASFKHPTIKQQGTAWPDSCAMNKTLCYLKWKLAKTPQGLILYDSIISGHTLAKEGRIALKCYFLSQQNYQCGNYIPQDSINITAIIIVLLKPDCKIHFRKKTCVTALRSLSHVHLLGSTSNSSLF